MKNIISHSISETSNIASQWLGNIDTHFGSVSAGQSNVGESSEAVVVALNGHLGSGKTTFVQAVARALGINENITSPTFVIMKKYDLNNLRGAIPAQGGAGHLQKFERLIHIDAYRLESGSELDALEFESLVSDPDNLILIEWAENVKSGLPENIIKINFEYVSENERKISFE